MGSGDDIELGATLKGFAEGQRVFNRYRLERILGRGGMGVVWLAFDEDLERKVALKFVPELVCLDKEAIADLKRETRRSLEITHANIVRIHDFHQDGKAAAISMEYIEGKTLSELKVERKGCLGVGELKPIVKQLCEALDYAHLKAKVVHRDLKPANLMLNRDGELKITDFGISCSISDSVSRVSMARGSSGTVVFMSPQQALGKRPTPADDIYALGATIYDLLSGKPPFYRGDVLAQLRDEAPQAMAERREELGLSGEPIPESWEATVRACLAKGPEARPGTAGEVFDRLETTPNIQHSTAKARVAPAADARMRREKSSTGPRPSRMGPSWAGIAAGVLLCAGVGWVVWSKGQVERGERAAAPAKRAVAFEATSRPGGEKEAAVGAMPSAAVVEPAEAPEKPPSIEDRAAAGEAAAQYELGVALLDGKSRPQDVEKAVVWFRKAADAGHAQALACVGVMYAEGRGVDQDDARAVEFYRRAADLGDPLGLTMLGSAWATGLGVKQDSAEAVRCFKKAAEAGDILALTFLGQMYADGQGVERDLAKAVDSFRSAAEKGGALGMSSLGEMYEDGRGVARDRNAAIEWYQKAAALGDEGAQEQLKRLRVSEVKERRELVGRCAELKLWDDFEREVDGLIAVPGMDAGDLREVASLCAQHKRLDAVYRVMRIWRGVDPTNGPLLYDLAGLAADRGSTNEARETLANAIEIGGESLRENARKDTRFAPYRALPEFRGLLSEQAAPGPGGGAPVPILHPDTQPGSGAASELSEKRPSKTKWKTRYIAVPCGPVSSDGRISVMLFDTRTDKPVDNTAYTLRREPKVGSVARYDDLDATYVGRSENAK